MDITYDGIRLTGRRSQPQRRGSPGCRWWSAASSIVALVEPKAVVAE
ncbi:hypothetical protein [Albidovulum sp.]